MLVARSPCIGAGIVAAIPAFWTLPPKLLAGAGAAGGIALINTLGQLGGIVSPSHGRGDQGLTGSTTPALYVIGLLCLLCAVLLLTALPRELKTRDFQKPVVGKTGGASQVTPP